MCELAFVLYDGDNITNLHHMWLLEVKTSIVNKVHYMVPKHSDDLIFHSFALFINKCGKLVLCLF